MPLLAALRQIGEAIVADLTSAWLWLSARATAALQRVFGRPAGDTEHGLREWPVAGVLWVGITAALLLALFGAQALTAG
jgi:hydrogenase-4 component B